MISTLDISSVTDRLVAYLDSAVNAWPGWTVNGGTIPKFTITVSGKMPETVRNAGKSKRRRPTARMCDSCHFSQRARSHQCWLRRTLTWLPSSADWKE